MYNILSDKLIYEINQIKNINDVDYTSKIINDLIETFKPERERMIDLWNKYKGDVSIKNKKMPDWYKENNRLANDFMGYIVQQGVGYTMGSPIVYNFDSTKYSPEDTLTIRNTIDIFNKTNDIELLDMTTCEIASVCGYASRLLYIDINGILRVMNIMPYDVIFLTDNTIDKTIAAVIIYQKQFFDQKKKTWEMRWVAEIYDDTDVSYYFEYEKGKFYLEFDNPDIPTNPVRHFFKDVPVIKIANNTLEQGDFEKCSSLIENYDRIISYAADNLSQDALSYLKLKGKIKDEDIIRAKATGIFEVDEMGDVDFITKNLPTEFTFKHLEELKQQIYDTSATIDPRTMQTNGNSESGYSRKIRYIQVDNKIVVKIVNFNKALYKQYDLMTDIWSMKKIPLNYMDMIFVFNKNIPNDLVYYGTAGQSLTGLVSHETILSQMPFINDPKEELLRLQKERELYGNNIDVTSLLEISGSN